MIIGSPSNPKIKYTIRLRKHSFRKREKKILVDGFTEVQMVLKNRETFTIFYCPAFFASQEDYDFLNSLKSSDKLNLLFEVTEDIFRKIAYRENPDGWLAIAELKKFTLEDIKLSENPFIVIAESVEKPGNLGTIVRTADATGAQAVILTDPTTDMSNPNAIRASIGAVFSVPVIEVDNETTLTWLKKNNFQILAAICDDKCIEYTEVDMTKPTAVLVGTEKTGLSEFWHKNSTHSVVIPMLGQVNSLNVAAATSIIMYEVVRQRRLKK